MGAEEQTEWGRLLGVAFREEELGSMSRRGCGPQVISHQGCFLYLFGLVYILEGEPHCATNHLIPLLSSSPQSIPGTKPFLSLKWVP